MDALSYLKFNFAKKTGYNFKKSRALITLYYHSIEKGLSHTNPRLGFGQEIVKKLNNELRRYIKYGFNINDSRFRSGVCVLQKYHYLHEENNFVIFELQKMYSNLLVSLETKGFIFDENYGGVKQYEKITFSPSEQNIFKKIVESRSSVRSFSSKPLDIEKVIKAIEIARNSPSACNRQPSKVYYVGNKKTIKSILEYQGGFRSWGDNLSNLLVLTASKSYYGSVTERRSNMIDGGIFGMTLLLSLHSLGIGTCILNATMKQKNLRKVKQLVNLSSDEDIVFFIAIGNTEAQNSIPFSKKDEIDEILVWNTD
jgi:nitroreductase